MRVVELASRGDHDVATLVAGVLAGGGVVVLPTDTVYGLAASLDHPDAMARLFDLKDRPAAVPIAVLVSDRQQVHHLAAEIPAAADSLMAAFWPGALTVVLQADPAVGPRLANTIGGDGSTIGVRCPDHDLCRAVSSQVGPFAATSANRHGDPTPTTAEQAVASLVGPVDLLIDGGELDAVPSTVVQVGIDGEPSVLREGTISATQILETIDRRRDSG